MIVPRMANPSAGTLYCAPSQSETPIPITSCVHTAMCGDREEGWVRARTDGSSRIRPMENSVRVAALEPAFELAMAELAMARKTSTHPAPHAARARPSHGFPPPEVANPPKRAGPKKTVAAYVVKT